MIIRRNWESILVSAVVRMSTLSQITCCKSLSLFPIELMLRWGKIKFKGFSMLNSLRSSEIEVEAESNLFLTSGLMLRVVAYQISKDDKIFFAICWVPFLLRWSLLLFRQDSHMLSLSTKMNPLPEITLIQLGFFNFIAEVFISSLDNTRKSSLNTFCII